MFALLFFLVIALLSTAIYFLIQYASGEAIMTRILRNTPLSEINSVKDGGFVRIAGVVEQGEHTLISPITKRACIAYRLTVNKTSGSDHMLVLHEEKSVEFNVRDSSGIAFVNPALAAIHLTIDTKGTAANSAELNNILSGDKIDPVELRGYRGGFVYIEAVIEPGESISVLAHGSWKSSSLDPASKTLHLAHGNKGMMLTDKKV